MTFEELKDKLKTSEADLVTLKKELDRKEKLLKAGRDVDGDGTFDDNDKKAVEDVKSRHETAKMDVESMKKMVEEIESNVDTTPTEAIIFDDLKVKTVNHRKLFTADKNAFKTQVHAWRNTMKASLNKLVDDMVASGEDGPTLGKSDILAVATSALSPIPGPVQTGIGIATLLTDLIEKHYRGLLPPTPSMREMETNFGKSVDKISDDFVAGMYDDLVKKFREENWMEPDEEFIYHCFIEDWDALIDWFREGKGLPKADDFRRPFMKLAINNMEDSVWDIGTDVGKVTVTMTLDENTGKFAFLRGEIDDLSSEVKSGLKKNPDIFGANKITMLPSEIHLTIVGTGTFDGTYCEMHRRSEESGSTDFKFIGMPIGADANEKEQATVYGLVMKSKAFDKVKITDIL